MTVVSLFYSDSVQFKNNVDVAQLGISCALYTDEEA